MAVDDHFDVGGDSADGEPPEPEPGEDVEDYSKRRRLKAIFDAQERVATVHDQVYAHVLDGDLPEHKAASYYCRVVQHYITLVEPLLKAYETKEDYWSGVNIGVIEVEPPEELLALADDRDVVVVGGQPEPVREPVVGLQDVLTLPEIVECEFRMAVKKPHRGVEHETATAREPLPEDVLLNAYRTTNQALRDIDLDLDLESDKLPEQTGFNAAAEQ